MATGLFVGAGASYELGMPLAWELTAELCRWLTPDKLKALNKDWRDRGGGHSEAVVEDIAALIARPEMHYEAILGNIQAKFQRPQKFREQYYNIYSWMVEIIYYILYFRHVKNEDFIHAGMRYFDGIIGLCQKSHSLWIFSVNHDLMIECVGAHFGVPVNCGLQSDISRFVIPMGTEPVFWVRKLKRGNGSKSRE